MTTNQTFYSINVSILAEILEEIRKQGFERPSPIQCQSWPILLSGHDLIGIAQTGTGKTLGYLLPAMIHIDNQPTYGLENDFKRFYFNFVAVNDQNDPDIQL